MPAKNPALSPHQLLFKELFVGTLIYAVTLGFFDDYTSIVYAKSFSTIFLAAIVMQILTSLLLQLKGKIITWLKHREGLHYRALMIFCLWLVLFLSKFVFLWAIDVVFGENMSISGFFGVLLIILTTTILSRLSDIVFAKLGDK